MARGGHGTSLRGVGSSVRKITRARNQKRPGTSGRGGKPIPYPPEDHAESTNYGFKILKGNPSLIDDVPEVSDNSSLRNALVRLNAPATPFFTIGCEKSFNRGKTADGLACFWARGYLEFAFNSKEGVSGAENYFILFFQFNQRVASSGFDGLVSFHWELAPARFIAANCYGWTACVWITTEDMPSEAKARTLWGEALGLLTIFLEGIEPVRGSTNIY